jgi:hypothetical protein
MTTNISLKRRIRERMSATGERYSTARMHILGVGYSDVATVANRPNGYTLVGGGTHPDTAAVHNALVAAGIASPHDDQPYSDALLYGLGGGTGFLYAVFEYQGMDPMLSIGVRHTMMGHDFARTALERAGIQFELFQTTSSAKADRAVDEALARGLAPIVTVDDPRLPYSGLPEMYCGMSAQQVAVVGADRDRVWLDDGGLVVIDRESFRRARGSYKKPKHHLMVASGAGTVEHLRRGVAEAIRANISNLRESPFKGFASNWGFDGMAKWARLLTDGSDPKSWAKVFDTDAKLFIALTRVYESIEWSYTPPSAGRGVYAEFLDEAAAILRSEAIRAVAVQYRDLATSWSGLASAAISGLPVADEYLELGRRFRQALEDHGDDAGRVRAGIFEDLTALASQATIPDRADRLSALSERISTIADDEEAATAALETAISGL